MWAEFCSVFKVYNKMTNGPKYLRRFWEYLQATTNNDKELLWVWLLICLSSWFYVWFNVFPVKHKRNNTIINIHHVLKVFFLSFNFRCINWQNRMMLFLMYIKVSAINKFLYARWAFEGSHLEVMILDVGTEIPWLAESFVACMTSALNSPFFLSPGSRALTFLAA